MTGHHESRLKKAAARLVERLADQTGIPPSGPNHGVKLLIHCTRGAGPNPSTIEDESYSLTVTPAGAHLNATTPYGVLRGMETLLQLVEPGPKGYQIPSVSIQDKPRFPWRGLLIDVCRHWIPLEVIKRNLDAMAAVKLNVLHWHLSDDQGFRVESQVHPLLHEMGSDGNYYSQDQVREIIRYASDRGIRVVPEFDMPGHTTSWVVGYPSLASGPGPYQIERKWGIHEPELDPTRESVYEFLDGLIGEMAALFPDSYFHVGGDEVNGRQWDSSSAIADYKQRQKLKDNRDLQAYFNKRVSSLLGKHGKKMLGWEEILHPQLPKDTVVQSWRGQKSLAEAVQRGYRGLLSSGYYLDLNYPASTHYLVDPIGEETAALSAEDRAKILGGEACMWGEFVSAETIDSRLWPRLAAIAERLWSPAAVRDVPDMYRRLDITSQRLEWLGIKHRTGYALMLQRLAGYQPTTALKTLCDIVEPVKGYGRVQSRPYTSRTPLNRLVDAARPESDQARRFASLVKEFLADPDHRRNQETTRRRLLQWQGLRRRLEPL
ncbi:MAG: beta-N-acetylhexosaminidase, partial [Acidobacteriota bacterium]